MTVKQMNFNDETGDVAIERADGTLVKYNMENVITATTSSDGGIVNLIDPRDGTTLAPADLGWDVGGPGGGSYPALSGEVGVINSAYPYGDVRRYGVIPDGTDVPSVTFDSTTTITAAAGTFKSSMVGAVVCSPLATGTIAGTIPKIVAVAGDGTSATLDRASAGSGTGSARIGTYWERDFPTRIQSVWVNASLPGVEIYWPPGNYVTSMNTSSVASGSRAFFDHATFSGLIHAVADNGYPTTGNALRNVKWRGDVTTYDRFGGIGIVDGDLSDLRVLCKSDATKHVQGCPGRGVHVYAGLERTKFGDFVVEDCPSLGVTTNTDGGFILDGSSCHDCSFGLVWVKDSAGHGVYVIGANHTFREIRVDGWGYGTHDRGLQESASVAQSAELTGVWLRRCSGLRVGTVRIGQISGARPNALYDFRIDDTANGVWAPQSWKCPRIDALLANSIAYRGVSIGDRNNPLNFAELSVGVIDVSPAASTVIATGYSMVHVNANSAYATKGRNKLYADKLLARNSGTSINDLLQVAAGADCDINAIDTWRGGTGHAGRVAAILGAGRIGRISHNHAGGSSSPTAVTVGPANDGPVVIGPIDAKSGGFAQITALDLTGATDFDIGPFSSNGYRSTTGAIKLVGASKGTLRLGKVTGYSSTGQGIRMSGCSNIVIDGGTVSTFATGISGNAVNGNTYCGARNLTVSGNTANTDLPSGQVTVDATCQGVTL